MNAPVSDPSGGETGAVHGTGPRVTVRYWAAAKAAAGRREDEVEAATVAEALAVVSALHVDTPRFAQVLAVCSFLLSERPLGRSDLASVGLEPGDVVDVLPPFAGG